LPESKKKPVASTPVDPDSSSSYASPELGVVSGPGGELWVEGVVWGDNRSLQSVLLSGNNKSKAGPLLGGGGGSLMPVEVAASEGGGGGLDLPRGLLAPASFSSAASLLKNNGINGAVGDGTASMAKGMFGATFPPASPPSSPLTPFFSASITKTASPATATAETQKLKKKGEWKPSTLSSAQNFGVTENPHNAHLISLLQTTKKNATGKGKVRGGKHHHYEDATHHMSYAHNHTTNNTTAVRGFSPNNTASPSSSVWKQQAEEIANALLALEEVCSYVCILPRLKNASRKKHSHFHPYSPPQKY